ncbi:hypothetical protein PR202_ga05339 [Eleusine coracana subsp. coracana]|uniref:Uncharacterized protein n=1 Tax=Eleusine coracana subsp. coracana TaxID=191504 RepID=A0AAV5BT91_ELECO|nr:hypothetical protein PR202_ga04886 [Eleusine coracana subsp. coracana]GJM89177.1 hypothetical protein PR202_ga05339 [Eleusine coracana subsp. coracana]
MAPCRVVLLARLARGKDGKLGRGAAAWRSYTWRGTVRRLLSGSAISGRRDRERRGGYTRRRRVAGRARDSGSTANFKSGSLGPRCLVVCPARRA